MFSRFLPLLGDRFQNGSPNAMGPLSCLSVTLVYCGQTAEWIRMPLGMKVGLGSGHIVLDRDPAPTTGRGTAAPTFRPMSIVAKRSPISATAELLYGTGLHNRLCAVLST